ncbi:hypothetical protein TSAR_013299 [Trichomalopsis sarcophagae]|uniref:Uncharacterized protein n=1 Tax=Trichomalopsis sarcophagae TaxID=543379 RepID=A0A232EFU5_9HYME|nr:hypothetical protein TSAR_013299 [Trichomalopsis sarcophagae]
MCIPRIKVSEESINLRTGKLTMVAWAKCCLGLKIVKNHKDSQFLPSGAQIKALFFYFSLVEMTIRTGHLLGSN